MAVVSFRRPGERTQAQIIADCEARYAEMEAEIARRRADPQFAFPCTTCRYGDSFHAAWCHHPLVKGFGDRFPMGMENPIKRYPPTLCGPEKALWERKLPIWKRLLQWLGLTFPPTPSETEPLREIDDGR